jgi:vacuolar protein sorting-associated protein 13A/C
MSNMKFNILRVAGSSDLIGNPYGFVGSLGSGMKKYYRDPREQIMQGPAAALNAGISLVGGTAGMAAHSAASVSGYLGRITGSVNRGIVAASLDREYIREKEMRDIKEKPTSTGDGIVKGFMGLGTSVFSGVTGLVTKPMEGSKQGGMGFMKGVGMGVAGLFTKPITGVVDLVSKTAQGIESGVTENTECKQNNERVRKPRAFYLGLNIVKEYN